MGNILLILTANPSPAVVKEKASLFVVIVWFRFLFWFGDFCLFLVCLFVLLLFWFVCLLTSHSRWEGQPNEKTGKSGFLLFCNNLYSHFPGYTKQQEFVL